MIKRHKEFSREQDLFLIQQEDYQFFNKYLVFKKLVLGFLLPIFLLFQLK
jgi:hypothetical protein